MTAMPTRLPDSSVKGPASADTATAQILWKEHRRQSIQTVDRHTCQPGDVHGPSCTTIGQLYLLGFIAYCCLSHQGVVGGQVAAA